MCDCDFDITTAKRVGRAHWVCPKCGDDVSLLYVLAMEVIGEDEERRRDQHKPSKG